jgi:hypothetical protein
MTTTNEKTYGWVFLTDSEGNYIYGLPNGGSVAVDFITHTPEDERNPGCAPATCIGEVTGFQGHGPHYEPPRDFSFMKYREHTPVFKRSGLKFIGPDFYIDPPPRDFLSDLDHPRHFRKEMWPDHAIGTTAHQLKFAEFSTDQKTGQESHVPLLKWYPDFSQLSASYKIGDGSSFSVYCKKHTPTSRKPLRAVCTPDVCWCYSPVRHFFTRKINGVLVTVWQDNKNDCWRWFAPRGHLEGTATSFHKAKQAAERYAKKGR